MFEEGYESLIGKAFTTGFLLIRGTFVKIMLGDGDQDVLALDKPVRTYAHSFYRTSFGGEAMSSDGSGPWWSFFGGRGSKVGVPRNPNILTVLRVEQATNLVKAHRGVLQLNGLTSITPTVAGVLARYRGVLFLNGLLTLPLQVATRLAKHRGPLYLGSVQDLSEDAREALHRNPQIHYPDRDSYEETDKVENPDGM